MNLDLWVFFLSSISRNRLDVEFGLGKCMKYFSSDLVLLVVDGGTFDQLRHMRNIGWILRNVGQTCKYLVNWRNVDLTCKYLVDCGIWRNVGKTCKYLVNCRIWRNVGHTCKYLLDFVSVDVGREHTGLENFKVCVIFEHCKVL